MAKKRKYKKSVIRRLTKAQLEKMAMLFDQLPNSVAIDEAIRDAVVQFPRHDMMCGVLTKAVLINVLYQTQIRDITKMAEHISKHGNEIDRKLNSEDITVVDIIRHGHGIRGSKGSKKEKDFYSFATKYVHFHKPDSFPIYDNRVKRLLTAAKKWNVFNQEFTQKNLKDYARYKSVVDCLANGLDVADWGYKKIDQGLWLWAKHEYAAKLLPSGVRKQLAAIKKG
jgi:hypothetical protein